ncbi:Gfo/Idh/MocA family oxidoreductase [Thalassococcus sp. CAU 1522]|uniref:Gfo/Idh/MocA family oxidoreductase n=1 Tax=Thalassococcus arenae TaxID=2851652 RepID=A0ABS6N629_9RHOB|nr:Gfo/Idh/MocA family oxidoreductase [Thalassococcus arenae]MBV2359479.1 Gfo/Idh/MocA family oxidoreductase [Thalassococcus arenae]
MKALLIGSGMVAQTHLLALRDNAAGIRLAGVLGRNRAALEPFCARAGSLLGHDVAAFTDLDAALADAPDMAVLITPPDTRLDYARRLSRAAIPTLMEKPVERTLDAARRIVAAYDTSGVPLGLCFQHRTRAASQRLKTLMTGGTLGDVVHVEIDVPWWRDQAYYDAPGRGTYARDGGGVMINQAIHTLDLALWLCGPVARLQALMRTSPLHAMEAEDIAAALLTFASGATGTLRATTTAYPGLAESLTLTTTRARIRLQGDALTLHWLDGHEDAFLPDSAGGTGGGADPMAFTHAWHQSVLEDFAGAIRDNRPPLAPGREALHVHAVIDAMERAARSGQTEEVSQ